MRSLSKLIMMMFFVVMIIGVLNITTYAATRTSAATGNWNATATWGGAAVPTAADSVIIAGGFTVTVNINNAVCAGMEVGSPTTGGGAGTLTFAAASQLTVTRLVHLGNSAVRLGSVNMAAGGTLICNAITVTNLGTWTPGTGTVQLNATNTLPATLTTYNNLIVNGGTSTVGVNTTLNGTLTVNTGAAFTIPAFTVTVTGATSVTGTLNITSTTGTKTFTGNVTVNSGGIWNNSANEAVSLAGNLQNDGTFTSGTGIFTFTGAAKTFSGANAISISSLTLSGTYTNNGTLTVATALAGAGTLTNGAAGILNIGQATAPAPTITATTAGNTVNYNAAGAQILKGTTYSNLTLSGSGAKTVTGTTVNGTLSLQGTATTTGTIPTYGGSAVIEYAGSNAQTTGIEMGTTVAPGVKINNANGVTLSADKTFNGTLTFTTGKLATSTFTLTAGTISGASTTSYVNGNLLKTFPTGGPTTRTFEVGDASIYAPASVTINNVTVAGSLTAKTTGLDHPNIATSGLQSAKDVNRYWTLTNTGMTIDNYNTTLNWQASDVDGGANTANFTVSKFDNPNWAFATSSGQTGTSITASGLTSFSDFAVGEPATFTITSSAGSNGSISPNGATVVSIGNSQHYSIAPNTGYHVDSLVIDGTPIALDTQYTFTNVQANHTIRAAFAIDQFTITATAGANGSITPSGSVVVDYNNSQHFSIAPNTGYHVDSLIIDGTPVAADTQHTFSNVTANHTIHAAFAVDQFTITATNGANGTITPNGAVIVDYNNSQHFSIAPNTGYHVDSLIIDGTPIAADTQHTFSNVTANHTIHVAFAIDQFTITATAGPNGTITPSGAVVVDYNNSQHFSIAPNTGYHVDSLIIDGTPIAVDTQHTFNNVTATHTIHVAFAIDVFTITPSAGTNGDISPSIPVNVNYGDSTTFTFTPVDGYHVDSIFIDGVGQPGKTMAVHGVKVKTVHSGVVVTYTFHNVTASHTIHVTFAINAYTVTASAGANGTITPSGVVNANFGDNVHFSIAANTGYHVDSLVIDGTPIAVDTQYTFNSVSANHTIHVAFAIDVFTITPSAGANGDISPSIPVNVNYGDSTTFTFTPIDGYHVDSIFIDGVGQPGKTMAVHGVKVKTVHSGVVVTYTFHNVTASHTIHVTFAINAYTVTASAGANGTITPSGVVNANFGDNVHFSIAANAGYHVDSLIIDGTPVAADTQYTFNSIAANHTINVTFALTGFVITASAGSHGTIAPSGAVFVQQDSNRTFTITPNAGYFTDSILVDDVAQVIAGSYTFTDVTAAHTIRIVFKAGPYNISIASGNWSDPATWSLDAVPVNTDSVIITNGTTVTLDVNGICGALNVAGKLDYSNNAARTLTVSTAGSLSGDVVIADTLAYAAQSNQRMFVGGNFSCTGAIIHNSTGSTGSFFVFNGTGTKSLASSVPLRGLQLSNAALELNLTQSLSITSGIVLNAGKLMLGNFDLTLDPGGNSDTGNVSSYIVTNGTGKLQQTVTTAASTFPIGTATSFNRVTLATETSSDVFGIRVLSSVNPASAKDSAAVQRTIDMSRLTADSLGFLTMTFGWDASEQGPLFVPASAASWRFDGTAWVEEGTFTPSGTGPYVGTISNILNTGRFAIGNAGALPITLAEFKGVTLDAHSVKIDWTTMSEQNTYGFYVQRRSDKSPVYSDVSAFIGGAGTTVNEQHAYSWTDTKATEGVYYYRLRTIDLNGDVEYSNAIKVNIVLGVKDRIPVVFKLNQNYPNPFNPTTKISFDLPENGVVTLKIYNVIGQEVTTLLNSVQYNAGSFTETFNAGTFSSGVYYYRITVKGTSHTYESLNKMMLVR